MTDARVLDWVRAAHASSTYPTSVCAGSLVLAAAGHGAVPTGERVVEYAGSRH